MGQSRPQLVWSGRLSKWQKVMFAADCDPDGDGWCQIKNIDPSECDCIGPTEENVEYKEKAGELYGRRVIACTPTWEAVLPIFVAAIENGSAKSRKAALEELTRMARLADSAKAA